MPGSGARVIRTITVMDDVAEGVAHLTAVEPRFAGVVDACGLPPLRRADAGLGGLMAIITEQQISVHAAAAIWSRIEARFAPFETAVLADSPDADFAACGLSRPKIRTIRAVLEACGQGQLDFGAMAAMADDQVVAMLTAIRGIGPWTAEIYLLANLGRTDVWPKGDLALQEAARLLFNMQRRPDAARMQAIAREWRPWRAVAARLLWSHYRAVKFKS